MVTGRGGGNRIVLRGGKGSRWTFPKRVSPSVLSAASGPCSRKVHPCGCRSRWATRRPAVAATDWERLGSPSESPGPSGECEREVLENRGASRHVAGYQSPDHAFIGPCRFFADVCRVLYPLGLFQKSVQEAEDVLWCGLLGNPEQPPV
jgi:hypothetical protein